MIPDPSSITVEQIPNTALFPRETINQIFYQDYGCHGSELFGPMWEYQDRRKHSYIFMTRELLNLLYTLKEQGLIWGIQADFGCSPWPATNIWFEDPSNDSLPDEARYALTEKYWAQKYLSAFEAIRTGQSTFPEQNRDITRILVDYHFMVHQLACELPDHPVTAEMELRAFNNEKDIIYDSPNSPYDTSHVGYRMGTNPTIIARLRQLNELSFESARRRATKVKGFAYGFGQPFINGAILSSLLNYIPWKAFLRKLDEHLLPGGLLVVYNAQEGERSHIDWKNVVEDQETIAAFVQVDLGYTLRVHELRRDIHSITPLYLVAQKINPCS